MGLLKPITDKQQLAVELQEQFQGLYSRGHQSSVNTVTSHPPKQQDQLTMMTKQASPHHLLPKPVQSALMTLLL